MGKFRLLNGDVNQKYIVVNSPAVHGKEQGVVKVH